jgi:hypothetical protein
MVMDLDVIRLYAASVYGPKNDGCTATRHRYAIPCAIGRHKDTGRLL